MVNIITYSRIATYPRNQRIFRFTRKTLIFRWLVANPIIYTFALKELNFLYSLLLFLAAPAIRQQAVSWDTSPPARMIRKIKKPPSRGPKWSGQIRHINAWKRVCYNSKFLWAFRLWLQYAKHSKQLRRTLNVHLHFVNETENKITTITYVVLSQNVYTSFSLFILLPARWMVREWHPWKLRRCRSVWCSLLKTYPESLSKLIVILREELSGQ